MNASDSFEHARGIAARQLVAGFDTIAGQKFPYRAEGYGDLWPGDRWTEAYLAIGKIGLAERAFSAVLGSIRQDGSFPHLKQGKHKRLGVETRFIDRLVYLARGDGITADNSGEPVTRLHGQPSEALSARALYEYKRATDGDEKAKEFAGLVTLPVIRGAYALYKARGREDGLVVSNHRDEMTNNSGHLAKQKMPRVDPSVNALLVQNNAALLDLAQALDYKLPGYKPADKKEGTAEQIGFLAEQMKLTRANLTSMVDLHVGFSMPDEPEFVLAAARIGRTEKLSSAILSEVFAAPSPKDKHPEKSHLSMAECIEIAKLTPERPESRAYLGRIYAGVADGKPITRFEDIAPDNKPLSDLSNRIHRKQIWLPAAISMVIDYAPAMDV